MNKIYKYLLISIFSLLLLPCFCSADWELFTGGYWSLAANNTMNVLTSSHSGKYVILHAGGGTCGTNTKLLDSNGNVLTDFGNNANIVIADTNYVVKNTSTSSCSVYFSYVPKSYFENECPSCPTCPSQYTSLECQTEYNLIPISSVTAQYCKINHDLIEPTDCPSYEGTGAVNRTARYINNEQYPGTASLNIFIPEFIKYSTTYNENQTLLDIEGYNADYEYIENVINNEKLTPTNEDFTTLLTGITAFIPYLFIALLIFWFVKVINRIWK